MPALCRLSRAHFPVCGLWAKFLIRKKLLLAAAAISGVMGSSSPASAFTDVCPSDANQVPYCKNVGKTAFNATGAKVLRQVPLGTIVGVAWRPVGSVISQPGFDIRVSPRDAYYFMIEDGARDADGNPLGPFLREAREIAPK